MDRSKGISSSNPPPHPSESKDRRTSGKPVKDPFALRKKKATCGLHRLQAISARLFP